MMTQPVCIIVFEGNNCVKQIFFPECYSSLRLHLHNYQYNNIISY